MTRFALAIGLGLFVASSAVAQQPPPGGTAAGAGQRAGGPPPMTNLSADRADNALAWLNLNLEFYPKSSRTYQIMAQAHQKKNDNGAAIKGLEKAVELDPNNNQAKTQLQQLKGQ